LPFLLRADIALALERASAFDEAPQACKDNSSLVGLPLLSLSGPGMLPMRARKDARRGLSPALTGGFNVPPLNEARPLALSPPAGFLPSLRCHAGCFSHGLPSYCQSGSGMVVPLFSLMLSLSLFLLVTVS
jgi:hypothetical protein